MISPADDEPESGGDTAEVRFADILRDSALSQNARHMRQLHVGADADIAVHPEFQAADADQTRMARREVLAGFVELGALLVGIRREPAADVRPETRHLSRSEAVAAGDLDRRDRGAERNPEIEILSVVPEHALPGLVEARGAHLEVVLAVKRHLQPA